MQGLARKLAAAVVLTGLAALAIWPAEHHSPPAEPGVGDVGALVAAYQRWTAGAREHGRDRTLVLSLSHSRGLSAAFTAARGQATLDLVDGSFSVDVTGLPAGEAFDVWLIDNRPGPGRSVKPEPGDTVLRAGRLEHQTGAARLVTRLGPDLPAGFEIDLVAVTRAGGDPVVAGLLFGAPTLFQRLYYHARQGGDPGAGDAADAEARGPALRRLWLAPFRALIPRPARAQAGSSASLAALVARGEAIFFNETFAGNGRTCGTCHPAENNFTIDPAFIATLPPHDPLFVAETNPALARNFENPALMRQLGLILENVDGFDDLEHKFVMRGVPHTLALSTSLTPAPNGADGTTTPPGQRTGWSGDGAPGGGTLREFAIGAVKQHFTRSLNRLEGEDFRLPTDEELDALEAFQLSLGRQEELDLGALRLRGNLPRRGLEIFLARDTQNGTVVAGKCQTCHANAGASVSFVPGGVNFNFDTGAEVLTDGVLPPDGGFGTEPDDRGGFGNGTFNTPTLVEAADTPPFFHNNAVATIEEAVAFFTTDAFRSSPSGQALAAADSGGIGIELGPDDVAAVAAFLRVINALENIRAATGLQERALGATRLDAARRLLRLATKDLGDAIEVLDAVGLHPGAVLQLKAARRLTQVAGRLPNDRARREVVRLAIATEARARALLVD
jgi:cytochrome c peroxidase